MKALSMLLIAGSFLAGAFLTVLHPREVEWVALVPVLLLGVVGLVLHRRAQHGEARASERLSGDMDVLRGSLDNIVENLQALNERGAELPVYEARFEIDRLFRDDLSRFAEARESMVHVFGIQNYADVMSHFAAGERYINRVWSASTDGYVDEVRHYLQRAHDQFRDGREHFAELLKDPKANFS
jgi:hypothetical protein